MTTHYRPTVFSLGIGVIGAAVLSGSACGLTSPEFVVRADSIRVDKTIIGNSSIAVRVFAAMSACAEIRRVERRENRDSLFLRIVGKSTGGGDCVQMPQIVSHDEFLMVSPQRRVMLIVEQPTGPPLTKSIDLPPS